MQPRRRRNVEFTRQRHHDRSFGVADPNFEIVRCIAPVRTLLHVSLAPRSLRPEDSATHNRTRRGPDGTPCFTSAAAQSNPSSFWGFKARGPPVAACPNTARKRPHREHRLPRAVYRATSRERAVEMPEPNPRFDPRVFRHPRGEPTKWHSRWFPQDPQSVAAARRTVLDAVPELSAESRGIVQLVVSELATNAVRHARSGFVVRLDRDAKGTLRIEVVDHGRERLAPLTEVGIENGRGLHIVERLSREWGWTRHPGGKVVWCVFDFPICAEEAV